MRFPFTVQVVVGLVVGLLGVLFTLQNFDVVSVGDVQLFWPLLVVAFGLCRVFERSGRVQGSILLILGGGVQLSNLGLFALPAREVVRYWPVLVALVGLWELALAEDPRAIVEGFAIASLGTWLQFSYFGVVHISSYRLWPLVLVVLGGAMALRGLYAVSSHS